MKTLGNIIWVIFGGFEWFVALAISGILLCLSIIGIPLGIQLIKLARFVIWPFGKEIKKANPNDFKKLLNIIWAILFGWIYSLCYLLFGLVYCMTLIGIPFGLQYFKIAKFILLPLGNDFI